ncbi:MAG: hypothetical protein AB7I59_30595 [Geminicoccaceae bacterium]
MRVTALVAVVALAGCASAAPQGFTLGWPGDGVQGRVAVWATPQAYDAETGPSCTAAGGSEVRVLARDVRLAEVMVTADPDQGCHGYVPLDGLVDHRDHPGLSGIDTWMPQQYLGRADGAVRPVFRDRTAAQQVEQAQLVRRPEWRVTEKEQANPELVARLACLVPGGASVELLESGTYTVAVEVVGGPAVGCRGVVFRHQLEMDGSAPPVWTSGADAT